MQKQLSRERFESLGRNLAGCEASACDGNRRVRPFGRMSAGSARC